MQLLHYQLEVLPYNCVGQLETQCCWERNVPVVQDVQRDALRQLEQGARQAAQVMLCILV